MEFRQFVPADILKPYVRHYYLFESDANIAFEDTVFPSGDMEMIFNLGEGIWESSVKDQFVRTPAVELWGQITRPLSIKSKGKHSMFGVKFYTHSAAYFLDDTIGVFNDQIFDLYDVIGSPIKALHMQLLEAKDINGRIALVESFLIRKLIQNEKKVYKIDKVGNMLSTIKTNATENNLSLIAHQHNVTPRYLNKLIYQYTGLTPKSYNKISRFQLSLQLIAQNAQSLTAIAYNCGYFDQSHFIRDFKFFTNVTPSSYLDNVTPVNQLLLQ